MPQVILPCPASMNDAELLKLKHRFDDVCQSSTTPELFELCRAGSHLVDSIRTLPRALTGTHEPPKVAGWYWVRQQGESFDLIQHYNQNDIDAGFDNEIRLKQWAGPIAPPVEG